MPRKGAPRDSDFVSYGKPKCSSALRKGDGWFGVLDADWRKQLETRKVRLTDPGERQFIDYVLIEHHLRSAKSDTVEQSARRHGLKHINVHLEPPARFAEFEPVDFFRSYAREGGRSYARVYNRLVWFIW